MYYKNDKYFVKSFKNHIFVIHKTKQIMTPKVKQLVITITVINFLLMCYVAQNYITIFTLTKKVYNLQFENMAVKKDIEYQKSVTQIH